MAFGKDAIGFYLQMEDEMTPQLPGVVAKYRKFVASMEKLNDKLYESTAGTQSHLGSIVKGLTKIAKAATMSVDLQLTSKSRKGFAKMVAEAVGDALAGARVRLRAVMPAKPSKLFAQDENLRTLYQNMPQPPDMLGKIQRFAEGGKVSGGEPGKDSVLGLLTPGEVVLPTDLVSQLEAAMGKLRMERGFNESLFGTEEDVQSYASALSDVTAAVAALTKVSGKDQDSLLRPDVVAEIAASMQAVATSARNVSTEVKTRLAPQAVNVKSRFEDVEEATHDASEEAKDFLSRVLGPARFIAIQTSLRGIQDGFQQLSGGVQQFSGEIGTGEFQSFPDRLREVRQRLGLTAEEAVKFTGAIAESSKTLGTNFFKSLEATDALIGAGEKDRDKLIEQSAMLARANRVTGADFEGLAKSVRLYTSDLGGASKNFDAMVLSIDNMTKSAKLSVNTPELMETLTASLNNPMLKGKGQEAIQNYANNLLGLRAAAETVFEGEAGIDQIFLKAMQGEKEGLEQMSSIARMSVPELQDAMLSKNGLVGVFDKLVSEIGQIQDPMALAQLSQDLGLSTTTLARFSTLAEKQRDAAGLSVPFEESATAGDKLSASMDKMTTAAERLTNTVANFVGSSGPMQSLVEFLDQVPVLALIAGAHLSGTLLKSFGALGKGMFGIFGGLFGGLGRLLGGGGGFFGKMFAGMSKMFGKGGAASAGSSVMGVASTVSGPGLLAASAKIGLVLAGVGAILLVVGTHSDTILPLLETALPGLAKIGKLVATEAGIALADTLTDLVEIFEPLGKMEKNFDEAAKGLKASAGFLFYVGLAGIELTALGAGAMVVDGLIKIVEVMSGGTTGTTNPLQMLAGQGQSIADTLVSLSRSFAPVAPLAASFETAADGLKQSAKFLFAFGVVGTELAVLGTGAMIADGIGKIIEFFGGSSPLAILRTQATSVVDTLLGLTQDLQRLAPVAERIPKLQVGLQGSAAFMTALKPLLDQTAVLGQSAASLGDGWFTSGPLSNLRTQAEPMIDTITDLSTWFTRVPINQKALAGVDYAGVFFSKLAVTVAAMQQVGSVDANAIRSAANALLDVRMSQPSATAAVSKDQIDQIMQVVVQSGEASPLHKDLQETNRLLTHLITVVQSGGTAASAATLPTRVAAPVTRVLDRMVQELTEMKR